MQEQRRKSNVRKRLRWNMNLLKNRMLNDVWILLATLASLASQQLSFYVLEEAIRLKHQLTYASLILHCLRMKKKDAMNPPTQLQVRS
jgi:hypothetical protein